MTNPPEFNIGKTVKSFLPLILIYGFNKLGVDSSDPYQLNLVRLVCGSFFALYFIVIFFLQYKIANSHNDKKSQKIVRYVHKKYSNSFEKSQAAEAKGVDPEKEDDYEYKEQTIQEYDLEQLIKLRNSSLTSVGITLVFHFGFGYLPPIVIQSVMSLFRLFEHESTRIYLFNADISRPYPQEDGGNGLMSMFGVKSETELIKAWEDEQKAKGQRPAGVYESATPAAITQKPESKKTK